MLLKFGIIFLGVWRFAMTSHNESMIFRDLRAKVNVETYILYDTSSTVSILKILPDEVKSYPRVLLTTAVKWKVKDFFDKRVVSLVLMNSDGNDEILRILKSSLNRWHLELVVFVTTETLAPFTKWLFLFRWCYDNGFLNSLLMNVETTSPFLTYDYYLRHQIYVTSLAEYLAYRQYFSNANGHPIRLTVGNNAPRSLVWYDAEQKLQLSGYYPRALQMFAEQYNASLKYLVTFPLEHYTEWNCLDQISYHTSDVCGDAMFMSERYITTNTEEISHSYLVVPYDKPLERFYYFLKPFRKEVWILVFLSLIYLMIMLSFIYRVTKKTWAFGLNFSKSLLALLNLPFELKGLASWRRKLLEILMIAAGFALANWYLSILSSLLFSRLYYNYINSPEDLVTHNVRVMISNFDYFVLNNSDISPLLKQQLMIVDAEVLQHNWRNLNPKYAYHSQYDRNAFYLGQQQRMLRPRMKELQNIPIDGVFGGVPMRPYWPWEERLSRHMSYLLESGIYLVLLESTFQDAIRIGYLEYFPTEYNIVEPLGLEYFQMPGALLLIGYMLAGICFLLEIILRKWCFK